jgi:hypothetical protein
MKDNCGIAIDTPQAPAAKRTSLLHFPSRGSTSRAAEILAQSRQQSLKRF